MNMKLRTPASPGQRSPRLDKAHGGRSDTVQSLSRALRLMNVLAKHDQGLGLSELAQTVGLPISTTHRLLGTLQSEHFVRNETERGVWLIGVQSFVVGNAFLRSRNLTIVARPYMCDLMEQCGETVNLAIEEDGEAVYLEQIECRQTMRAIARTGGRAAMHASGVGKAMLAAMSDNRVEWIITRRGLSKVSEKTITTRHALRAELAAIRERGFALDDEENAVGLRCIASPIFDERSEPIAALSLSGPTVRIKRDMTNRLGQMVRDAAARITAQLGGARPND